MITLDHFDPSEFGGWFDRVDVYFLVSLDILRRLWGKKIQVSGDDEAVGRHGGESESRHNIDKWGSVFAADLFPDGVSTIADAKQFIALAKSVGFNGIGLYPKWSGGIGFHLDRRDVFATWGAYYAINDKGKREQKYCSLNDALQMLEG